jgi:hypothetical protein
MKHLCGAFEIQIPFALCTGSLELLLLLRVRDKRKMKPIGIRT